MFGHNIIDGSHKDTCQNQWMYLSVVSLAIMCGKLFTDENKMTLE